MAGKSIVSRIETDMRVGDVRQGSSGPAAGIGGEAAAGAAESRALVVLTPARPAAPTGHRQVPFQVPLQVPFLAHLLAVKAQHAQTRERRRADPHEAIAAYRTAAELVR